MPGGPSTWSLARLVRERDRVTSEIDRRRRKGVVLARIEAMVREAGYELDEVVAEVSVRRATRSGASPREGKFAAPKYRHPHDPNRTWTGRGGRPRWFATAIEDGATAQSMAL